jgi:integrase
MEEPQTRPAMVSTLKTYARPVIGSKPVSDITTEDILQILKPIWNEKTETAKRVQGRIERVLDYARASGLRSGDNPAQWRGHLGTLLSSPNKVKPVRNMPAMPHQEVPAFMSELAQIPGIAALALKFTILTGCRSGEVRGATWDEIDLDGGV